MDEFVKRHHEQYLRDREVARRELRTFLEDFETADRDLTPIKLKRSVFEIL